MVLRFKPSLVRNLNQESPCLLSDNEHTVIALSVDRGDSEGEDSYMYAQAVKMKFIPWRRQSSA